jgi:hypothetical protein
MGIRTTAKKTARKVKKIQIWIHLRLSFLHWEMEDGQERVRRRREDVIDHRRRQLRPRQKPDKNLIKLESQGGK